MKKRSFRPFVYLTLLCVGALFFVGLGAYLFLHWSVERRIAALRAAGQPVTLADLEPPTISDDQNAAVLLDQIAAELDRTYTQIRDLETFRDTALCDFGMVAHLVDKNPELIEKLRQVAERPDCRIDVSHENGPMAFIEMEYWIRCRQVAVLARTSAVVQLCRGDPDDAAREALRTFRVSRHATTIRLFLNYIIRINIQSIAIDSANLAIQRGRVSGDLLEQLDSEARIELEGEATLYSQILAGERAWSLASLREQERPWYFLPLKPVDASLYLEGMEREVQWAQEGTSIPPKGSVDLSWLPAAIANELTGASAASTARNARLRSIAQLRCLRVLIALARRRAASEPEQPRIDALGLNAEDIRDPFSRTGESLKLLRREGAWVIYSIGENQLDDGGSLDYLDIGVGVPELP